MLLSHPGFESICPNSWVLVTATIGFKTEQKKAFTTFFAEGNTIGTWDSGKPQKLEFERGNSRVWNHPFLAASAAKKFTNSQINVKFDFWPKQLHWLKIQTPFANSRLIIVTSITIKRKTVGDCKLLACDGKVRKSRTLYPKSKILILYPKQPIKYGAEYVAGAHV